MSMIIPPNCHNIHLFPACSVCLLDILQLWNHKTLPTEDLVFATHLDTSLFEQLLTILKEGCPTAQEVDEDTSVPPYLVQQWSPKIYPNNIFCHLKAIQSQEEPLPNGRHRHRLQSPASCSFQLPSPWIWIQAKDLSPIHQKSTPRQSPSSPKYCTTQSVKTKAVSQAKVGQRRSHRHSWSLGPCNWVPGFSYTPSIAEVGLGLFR